MLTYPEILGPALRLLRSRRHLKQMQVAAKAGITKAMLSSYETGSATPSLQSLALILGALETDFREFQDALYAVGPGGPRVEDSNGRNPRERGGEDAPLPELLVRQLDEMQSLLERIAMALENLAPGNPGLGLPEARQELPQG